MIRRAALLALLLCACATPPAGEPSLAPRAAEAIDPRVPIPSEVVVGPADPALTARIGELMSQVRSGNARFQVAADEAERLTAAAGPAQSDSWILAQQAISAMVAARAPVTGALADLDALAAARLAASGGMPAGDLAAIQAASAQAGAVSEAEAAAIDRLQAQLSR